MQVKRCTKCGEVKPLDGFSRQKAGKFGVTSRCKSCDREYRLANCDWLTVRKAEYRAANREHARQKVIAWREANPERAKASVRAYYAANRERLLCWNKDYYDNLSPERKSAISRASKGARRARESAGGYVSAPTVAAVLAEGLCVWCGAPATEIDHVRPLAQGGKHDESNLVPSCRRCNRQKSARLLTEWDAVRVQHGAEVSAKVAAELARQLGSHVG